MVFQGNSALTLDAKGRMTIPARYRDALMESANGALTITRNFDGGLLIYPRHEWEEKREAIMKLPMSARHVQRMLLGNAQDVDIDSAGRVLIAPELRNAAAMVKEVVLVGMGRHFDLWDAQLFAQMQAEDMAKGLPESLDDFSL
ncbi:MAG: division/cell wall cluster transcriptional repressor MraZ [Alcaligenaceae bacterium]|nr:division/cell wall cluster transcriptional repressor MraZ [Alcaligenaceae bacterium]